MKLSSLRARLIVIILAPLFVIALIAGAWQFANETQRAEEIFDRGLLSAALAISRDVAISDGDALSPATRRLVNNTSGGELFYHVYAPDGVFVTGYSTPPVAPGIDTDQQTEPFYYNGTYQGKEVRVLRFRYITSVSDVAGEYNVTVWQNASVRAQFVREVVSRTFAIIALLVFSVGLVVWFGVGVGLRPLLDLEDAIAKRSPTELEPIRREVPVEAKGLVTTLNSLLDRVSRRISSKDEFISNAAHQLRNPIAGVLALAESVETAPSPEASRKRSGELVEAARQASQLANQLLSFERAAGVDVSQTATTLDLNDVAAKTVARFRDRKLPSSLQIDLRPTDKDTSFLGDGLMIEEAILNLLNNAVTHGGPTMNTIELNVDATASTVIVTVADNGIGIPSDQHIQALSRFMQTNGGPGTGLGLPIANKVMSSHKGTLEFLARDVGTAISLTFPRSPDDR